MDDWELFLKEVGLTQEQLDAVLPSLEEPMVEPEANYYLGPSHIHGTGIFALDNINGMAGRLMKGDKWYVAGRYANHSPTPNMIPIKCKDEIIMYGLANKDEELTLDYRHMRKLLEH